MKKNSIDISANAFTLVELLVVIAIIAILVGIATFGSKGSFESARDAKRRSDIKQYQVALEVFANSNNGLYPSKTSNTHASDYGASSSLCSALGLSNCPEDPEYVRGNTTMSPYLYRSDGTDGQNNATMYVLWAKLENGGSNPYWVVCSNGKSGASSGSSWSLPTCPL